MLINEDPRGRLTRGAAVALPGTERGKEKVKTAFRSYPGEVGRLG